MNTHPNFDKLNERDLRHFGKLRPGVKVHHIAQFESCQRDGRRDLAVVGEVVDMGFTANMGTPWVEVFWYGPEGGYENYEPTEVRRCIES